MGMDNGGATNVDLAEVKVNAPTAAYAQEAWGKNPDGAGSWVEWVISLVRDAVADVGLTVFNSGYVPIPDAGYVKEAAGVDDTSLGMVSIFMPSSLVGQAVVACDVVCEPGGSVSDWITDLVFQAGTTKEKGDSNVSFI